MLMVRYAVRTVLSSIQLFSNELKPSVQKEYCNCKENKKGIPIKESALDEEQRKSFLLFITSQRMVKKYCINSGKKRASKLFFVSKAAQPRN
jgi:hypothetical protein